MKKTGLLNIAIVVFLAIGVLALLFYFSDLFERRIVSLTFSDLRSESVLKLSTHEIATQVAVEREEKNLLFGSDKIVLIVPVKLVYGYDLDRLADSDITCKRQGSSFILDVEFPEFKPLYKEVFIDQAKFVQKGNLLMVIKKRLKGENIAIEAQKDILEQATSFAKEQGLVPSREESLRQIEGFLEHFSVLGKLGIVELNLH